MPSGLAEDLLQELRRAVRDERLLVEPGTAVDEHGELHDAAHFPEVSDLRLQRGETVQAHDACGLLGLLERDVAPDLSRRRERTVLDRTLARDENEVPRPDGRNVG